MGKVLSNTLRLIKLVIARKGVLCFMFARLMTDNNVNHNIDNKSLSVRSHIYKALLKNRRAYSTQSVRLRVDFFLFLVNTVKAKDKGLCELEAMATCVETSYFVLEYTSENNSTLQYFLAISSNAPS